MDYEMKRYLPFFLSDSVFREWRSARPTRWREFQPIRAFPPEVVMTETLLRAQERQRTNQQGTDQPDLLEVPADSSEQRGDGVGNQRDRVSSASSPFEVIDEEVVIAPPEVCFHRNSLSTFCPWKTHTHTQSITCSIASMSGCKLRSTAGSALTICPYYKQSSTQVTCYVLGERPQADSTNT